MKMSNPRTIPNADTQKLKNVIRMDTQMYPQWMPKGSTKTGVTKDHDNHKKSCFPKV